MGIGAGYCEGNLNFATASEDDEVYTKKKVSRVSHGFICIYTIGFISAIISISCLSLRNIKQRDAASRFVFFCTCHTLDNCRLFLELHNICLNESMQIL